MNVAELFVVPDNAPTLAAMAPITDLDEAVRFWLGSEVANGAPREDTIKGYRRISEPG